MTEATVAEYLLRQLQNAGVDHVFGIPGDYVLGLYKKLAEGPLLHIGTTREDTAAFADDGYARCRGLGALAVTYGVGALNVVNAIAGAHAESSPVVVISGAPGLSEQRQDPMIHHRFGPFSFQREIFERITCATAVLDDPLTAFRDIDRCLQAARRYSKPVYLELPRDQLDAEGYPIPAVAPVQHESDAGALKEAVAETLELLGEACFPVILAGVEIHRRGLQELLSQLVLSACIPVAATLTGKSVVGERHAAYLGVYEGAMGPEYTRECVEGADVLLMLGAIVNDVDTGIFTAKLDPERMIHASQDQVTIGHHRYPDVRLQDFLAVLCRSIRAHSCNWSQRAPLPELPTAETGKPMTIARLISSLNAGFTPATFSRLCLDPVVIVFNNHGYSSERFILEGPFNDIAEWRYEHVGDLVGAVNGFLCGHRGWIRARTAKCPGNHRSAQSD